MVNWIRANKPAKLEGLWQAVLPEGGSAPPADFAADLFWLLLQGHVLLFTDDTLVVQELRDSSPPQNPTPTDSDAPAKKRKKKKKSKSKPPTGEETSQETTSTTEDEAPAPEDATPTPEDATPTTEESAPVSEETGPTAEESAPVPEEPNTSSLP